METLRRKAWKADLLNVSGRGNHLLVSGCIKCLPLSIVKTVRKSGFCQMHLWMCVVRSLSQNSSSLSSPTLSSAKCSLAVNNNMGIHLFRQILMECHDGREKLSGCVLMWFHSLLVFHPLARGQPNIHRYRNKGTMSSRLISLLVEDMLKAEIGLQMDRSPQRGHVWLTGAWTVSTLSRVGSECNAACNHSIICV